MKTCVIYANCQGVNGIYNILSKTRQFTDIYNIIWISVHECIIGDKQLNHDDLKRADLFIYQPIADIHGDKSTAFITNNILKKECTCISFPYVYSSAVFSTYLNRVHYSRINGKNVLPKDDLESFKEKSVLHGFSHVYHRIEDGASLEEIINLYRSGDMDFNFDERWKISIDILRQKETTCDVKIADFLDANKTEMLFLTHNHPTTIVFWHMVSQILHLLQLPFSVYPTNITYDISSMIKYIGHHPFQEFVQHYNSNTDIMGHFDRYSKAYWGKTWEYVVNDKHTEWEIMDYYMKYKDIIYRFL